MNMLAPSLIVSQQLATIVFQVSALEGFDWEVIVDESWHKTGSGNQTFNTSLFGVGQHNAILYIAGLQVATASYNEQEVVTPEPQPPKSKPDPAPGPLPTGAKVEGDLTARCELLSKTSFGESWFTYRLKDTGEHGTWRPGADDARSDAHADPRCAQPLPPTHVTESVTPDQLAAGLTQVRDETTASITKTASWLVSAFSDSLNMVVEYLEGRITKLTTYLEGKITDLGTSLEGKISGFAESILNITDMQIPNIWDKIGNIYDASVEEAAAWRTGVLDLDASLKAWIAASILDIIWAAITRDSKED